MLRYTDQPLRITEETPLRTPPDPAAATVVIQEPDGSAYLTATTKEKVTAVENAEARALEAKKARAQAVQQRAEAEVKLGEAELRVACAESIITARDKEIVELKVALEESENKYYNMGFNDVENSAEPVMGLGWMATVTAIGLLEDSLFRNLDQIPYLEQPPPTN
ncbi:hypothetical protein SO802_031248 [Lithocarpus litseifolius]|uniref:Uncharacterized protein n=1 Tax=Lithocarpus litseifolius TaxID=425828 RepID=A0AAW2BMC9_9ROSI